MSSSLASIGLAASNGEWGSNVVLNDLVIRTSNVSQQVHVISNSNVGLRVSNDTVFVQSNLRAWSVAAPVMNASNLITSNVTSCNLVSSNCTFGAVTVTGTLTAPGLGGLGTAIVQHRLPTSSNPTSWWYSGNVWNTRPLNVLVANTNSNVLDFANNQLWLQPGTYACTFDGLNVSSTGGWPLSMRLYNSNNGTSCVGMAMPPIANNSHYVTTGTGLITVGAPSNALQLQTWIGISTSQSNAVYTPGATGVPSLSNIHTTLTLQRLA
jgi:hypothetical protein